MGQVLSQTGGTSATGDLTNMLGNDRLALLCPASNGTVSTSAVTDIITDAEAEALSILGPGYNTASVTTKAVVKTHTKQIAIYYAYARKPEFRTERGDVVVAPQYERAIKALESIRDGDRDMGDETSTGKSALVGGTVNSSTSKFIVETDETTSTGPTGGF